MTVEAGFWVDLCNYPLLSLLVFMGIFTVFFTISYCATVWILVNAFGLL